MSPAVSIRRAFQRPIRAAAPDAASAIVSVGSPHQLATDLQAIVGEENVLSEPIDLVRFGTDASPYRYIPAVVVRPRSIQDVQGLLDYARKSGRSLTFRAGGTSLNGQSQTDDILVDVREHFREISALGGGKQLRSQPGIVLTRANAHLAPYGRKLGPDPASSAAATIGGVLANNASGMTCGTQFNSYRTLASATIVLASGTVIDTGSADADAVLEKNEPALFAKLVDLRDRIRADEELSALLRRKFAIKNTSGYRLDAFLDEDSPAQILRLLAVGSEGTLGFIADTVWNTLELGRRHTTAFFRFPTLESAAAAVPGFNDAGAQAVELLDAASIRSAAGVAGAPDWMRTLGPDATDAAVLIELRSNDEAALAAFESRAQAVVDAAQAAGPVTGSFTRDSAVSGGYWRVRSGLLATVGAARPPRTALITEDVCVPPTDLASACPDLQRLLVEHGFTGAVNGHASAGNLHFYLYLDAADAQQVATYRRFMDDLVDLICDKYHGSLKGEHGTGRNMTPYIEQEWGTKAIDLMWEVKHALDPDGLLAPGVFLNKDKDAAFRNLKSMPLVAADLDPCIECGFCEPVCPSRHITTTPRQRIALQRELARQGWHGPLEHQLVEDYEYDAVNTCAGDSSCAIACPVGIDTGHAMKRVRRDSFSPTGQRVGKAAAKHFGAIAPVARVAIGAAGAMRVVIGDRGLRAITDVARTVVGKDIFPQWLPEMPGAAPKLPTTHHAGAQAVLFAACINRIFGPPRGTDKHVGVTQALVALGERTGHPLWIPDDIAGDCCATIWQSKGLKDGNELMAARIVEDMHRWSAGGKLPIVVDAASCTLGVTHEVVEHLDAEHKAMHAQLTIMDSMTWVRRYVLPDLSIQKTVSSTAVHPTCSMHTLGIEDDLIALAHSVADDVVVPITATCCGFAGDRGFLHKELNETATEEEAAEVRAAATEAHLSGNRTCELGMEHGTGETYEHVIVALERASRPASR
ncbi:FAD-binding and (Fe-S)-binding domain-containing protein [Rarobacter incanus]|uniref:D-lactate dehydrogenase (cytochrome) n=1 Tax=Rarobacter incanus TaxID=153494 RepID=A0A542SMJ3_9MICO|nr:FAD-binding and (Fe-S)-binding domain-containing protein [Rarobacter incanus]TQK75843.1 D-lactate dehydrogenase [Rarobacter incanus]